jgi:hypothetical protein
MLQHYINTLLNTLTKFGPRVFNSAFRDQETDMQ